MTSEKIEKPQPDDWPTRYLRCRYPCCDRRPTYTDGMGDDPCPEHGRYSIMECIEAPPPH